MANRPIAGLGRRALLLGAAAPCVAEAYGPLHDLMPAFWTAYEALPAAAPADRARALISTYFQPHVAAYRGAGVGRVDMLAWLGRFDPIAGRVRALSQRLPGLWCDRLAHFRTVLPDAAPAVPATALVSFLWFDGKATLWQGRVTLFLGLDMIVLLHGDAPAALLDHERFHLYHHEVNASLILPGGDPLWLGIWKEGLAVYATALMNPGAPRRTALLGDDALASMTPDVLRRVASELPDRLGATDVEGRARYLQYGHRSNIPARSGYALGLAIVEDAAAGQDLAALARIPAPEIERIVRRGLAALAAG